MPAEMISIEHVKRRTKKMWLRSGLRSCGSGFKKMPLRVGFCGEGSPHNSDLQSKGVIAEAASLRKENARSTNPSWAQVASRPRWYVVQTRPHGEARAILNLERQAFHLFCPHALKTVRHARTLTRSMAPLFPSYLFVFLDVTRDQWHAINGTRGVVRLLSQGESPVPVPDGVVEALQARADERGLVSWISSLKLGQSVRISEGPFANFVGTLEMLDDLGRVRVLLELMGRSVVVALQGEVLIPVA